ncbi:MAG TPA: phosphate ABC transporter substrate-binding protein PstS, partial [Gemmataceae bacterium]|nr:phosphate ABC transporter substrate-binding protein PstS [Gemmataceae bacterium]
KPAMDKWIDVYSKDKGAVEINYQGQGSTAGIKQMTEKAVNFGCTDAFMTEEQLAAAKKEGGEVVHVPLVMGGVVPAYNLPGIDKPLNFTGEVLAGIFLGDITNWNDAKLKALNEGVKLPDQKISVVHRAEGSGTTAIFTEFLSMSSPKWKEKVGTSTTVTWPVGSGEKGNPAVANNIGQSHGSIGYVELIYALQKKDIKFGAVKNKAGKFVLADLKSVNAAAASLKDIPADLRFSIVDAPGDDSYPISGTTWAVFYQDQKGDAGREMVKFFTWVVHDGQQYSEKMHYAALPQALVARIDEKLKTIKVQ